MHTTPRRAAGFTAAQPPPPVDGPTYRIATDTTFAPFEFEDEDGNLVGIDMDLLRAIVEEGTPERAFDNPRQDRTKDFLSKALRPPVSG